jgi:hypothetical protein
MSVESMRNYEIFSTIDTFNVEPVDVESHSVLTQFTGSLTQR